MPDSFTETTSESLGGRLIDSIKGILFGVVLAFAALVLLFWNEGRAVRTADMLSEGAASVVSVQADKVDPANEGRLVHVTGDATTADLVADPQFGVSAKALQLRRQVETFAWVEHSTTTTEKRLGGGEDKTTTYKYDTKWTDKPMSSAHFRVPGHQNPAEPKFKAEGWMPKRATLGAFTLPDSVLAKLKNFQPLPASADKLSPELKAAAVVADGALYFGVDPKRPPSPQTPAVGDTRVTFQVVDPGAVSVVGKQLGQTFEPYGTKNGEDLLLVESGTVSDKAMFKQAEDSNAQLGWILRAAGWILCCIGLFMVLRPIAVVADVIPFFGSIVAFGAGLGAFVVGSFLSLLTIAVSWIGHRPLLGIALLVAAGGVLFGGKLLAATKKKPVGAAQAA